MIISDIFKIHTFFIFICLFTLVKSVPTCPLTQNDAEEQQKYIIQFSSASATKNFSTLLNHCNKTIKTIVDFSNIQSDLKHNGIIQDVSFGNFYAYIGYFGSSDVDELIKLNGIINVEKDSLMGIHILKNKDSSYGIQTLKDKNSSSCLSTRQNPNPNLDRIDQEHFPLNGEYMYPSTAGNQVKVYILDTGIKTDHDEFGGRATFGTTICEGCSATDDNGHGTHVAGIVGGQNFGVANQVSLIAVKVCTANGTCSTSDVILGLNYVSTQYSTSYDNKAVINLSLGGPVSNSFNDAVNSITKIGIHVVVSAGNNYHDNACNYSPASALSAITVGATEATSDNATDFTNIGSCVSIFAPGRKILSAGIYNETNILSGTSQAAPHVTGTIALVIANTGNLSPSNMKEFIINLATKNILTDIDSSTPNNFLRVPYTCNN
ncbi:13360_t:CDS:2 [Dentiscutata heterogama]|uniref:13360_t:CDS:1 n=1 Tax=Dentiscutata heterogama TaxID=1316150 RepID=A0ACA9M087_9GLOM|nr:13360_t:CDS:2 [Dentiscutata heterogama]